VVEGRVQGVGFRAWIEREARARGLAGFVRNRKDGSLEAVFCGAEEDVRAMVERCHTGPRLAAVTALRTAAFPEHDWTVFEVWPTE
jgi:acylphosphatase